MSTSATRAYGTQLFYREAGETNYIHIAQTQDLASPSPEVGEIDITNNSSPNGSKEYIPGLKEPGDVEFTVVYEKSACAELFALQDGETVFEFAMEYVDGAGWTFDGFVKGFGTEGETDDGYLTNTVSIKVTGAPAFHETISISEAS